MEMALTPKAPPAGRRLLQMREDHTNDFGSGLLCWLIDANDPSLHLTWTLSLDTRTFTSVKLAWRHRGWMVFVAVEVSGTQFESLSTDHVLREMKRMAEERINKILEVSP